MAEGERFSYGRAAPIASSQSPAREPRPVESTTRSAAIVRAPALRAATDTPDQRRVSAPCEEALYGGAADDLDPRVTTHVTPQQPFEGGAAATDRYELFVARRGCHGPEALRRKVEQSDLDGSFGEELRVEVRIGADQDVSQPRQERVGVPTLRHAPARPAQERVFARAGARSGVGLDDHDVRSPLGEREGRREAGDRRADDHGTLSAEIDGHVSRDDRHRQTGRKDYNGWREKGHLPCEA